MNRVQLMEAMLEDQDETYRKFYCPGYGYTLTEKKARTGYMVHRTHREDFEIEKITVASALSTEIQQERKVQEEDPQSEVYLGKIRSCKGFIPLHKKKKKKTDMLMKPERRKKDQQRNLERSMK